MSGQAFCSGGLAVRSEEMLRERYIHEKCGAGLSRWVGGESVGRRMPRNDSALHHPLHSPGVRILSSQEREKPVRCSVAAVIRREDEAFLAVRRPLDDDRLPGVWGLPAITLRPGELPEAGLRRIGTEKLGIELEPTRFIGIRSMDRGDYELILMDLEARVISGEPDVHSARTTATAYIDQRWSNSVDLLRDAAARGSLCSRILIEATDSDGVPE